MQPPLELTPAVAQDIGDAFIGMSVQRAARSVGRLYDAAFRPIGLSGWQFSLLIVLERSESPTIGEVAETLALDPSTATTNVKLLERRGLVKAQVDEADKRVRRVALTEEGRAVLMDALPRWKEAQKACLERLGHPELCVLRKAMEALSK